MRAVLVSAPGAWEVTDVPEPAIGDQDLLVRVQVCGICGTDTHILDGGLSSVSYPLTPGHELAGEVVGIGSGVTSVAVGQRVAVDPNLPCHRCHYCRIGRGNLCSNYDAVGVTRAGGFAELVAVPEASAYLLPDDLPVERAGLVEPVSCALHGLERLPPLHAAHVLVYGAGTMGLLMASLTRRAGALSVSVVDREQSRLDFAAGLGVDATSTDAGDLAHPDGFEVVVDATGAVAAITDGLTRVRTGGTFLQFGVTGEDQQVPFSPFAVYNREISIIGSMAVHHSFGAAVDLLSAVDELDGLVTDVVPLDRFDEALELFRSGRAHKVQVAPDRG